MALGKLAALLKRLAMIDSSGQRRNSFYGTFKGESCFVAIAEALLALALWKNWSSPPLNSFYAVTGIVLVLLLILDRHRDTEDGYQLGKTFFAF